VEGASGLAVLQQATDEIRWTSLLWQTLHTLGMSIGLGEQRGVGSRPQERLGLVEGYKSLGLVPNGNGGKGNLPHNSSIGRGLRTGRGRGGFTRVEFDRRAERAGTLPRIRG